MHRGGRVATAAHPLCTCRRPVDYPPKPDWSPFGPEYEACQTADERRDYLAADMIRSRAAIATWREECERVRLAHRCEIHRVTPSVWSKPW